MEVVPYSHKFRDAWDEFVSNSCNGTYYHTRTFIDDSFFSDASIMGVMNHKVVFVFPCCLVDGEYWSHKGATFGGPVVNDTCVTFLHSMCEKIKTWYGCTPKCRIAGGHWGSVNTTLCYLLGPRVKLELCYVVNTADNWIVKNKDNRRLLMKDINIIETQKYYEFFYEKLKEKLNEKHHVDPTHTKENFINVFIPKVPHTLYTSWREKEYQGGVLAIRASKQSWYIAYITPGKGVYKIMQQITIDARREGVQYIDYGVVTESNGDILNVGLAKFKQDSYGGLPAFRYLVSF